MDVALCSCPTPHKNCRVTVCVSNTRVYCCGTGCANHPNPDVLLLCTVVSCVGVCCGVLSWLQVLSQSDALLLSSLHVAPSVMMVLVVTYSTMSNLIDSCCNEGARHGTERGCPEPVFTARSTLLSGMLCSPCVLSWRSIGCARWQWGILFRTRAQRVTNACSYFLRKCCAASKCCAAATNQAQHGSDRS